MGLSFQIESPVTEDELAAILDHLQQYIDPSITRHDTMASLKQRPRLSKFMDTHCRLRHYHFSIKKCGEATCEFCFPIQLPNEIFAQLEFLPDPMPAPDGEHYKPFSVSKTCNWTLEHIYGNKCHKFIYNQSSVHC